MPCIPVVFAITPTESPVTLFKIFTWVPCDMYKLFL